MQTNDAKQTSSNQMNYGENYYAPVADFHNNSDLNSNSTQSSNPDYPQIDTDAFKAQQAGYQVEGSTKKLFTVYEHYPEHQPIQTVIKPKKPHNCGKCEDCENRRKREREERLRRERDECIGACLIEFCCLIICKAILRS